MGGVLEMFLSESHAKKWRVSKHVEWTMTQKRHDAFFRDAQIQFVVNGPFVFSENFDEKITGQRMPLPLLPVAFEEFGRLVKYNFIHPDWKTPKSLTWHLLAWGWNQIRFISSTPGVEKIRWTMLKRGVYAIYTIIYTYFYISHMLWKYGSFEFFIPWITYWDDQSLAVACQLAHPSARLCWMRILLVCSAVWWWTTVDMVPDGEFLPFFIGFM